MKTSSREETIAFAKNYAKSLQSGDILLLSGDLGQLLYKDLLADLVLQKRLQVQLMPI